MCNSTLPHRRPRVHNPLYALPHVYARICMLRFLTQALFDVSLLIAITPLLRFRIHITRPLYCMAIWGYVCIYVSLFTYLCVDVYQCVYIFMCAAFARVRR